MSDIPPWYLYLGLGVLLTGWALFDLVRYTLRVRRGRLDKPFDNQNYLWFALGLVLLLLVYGAVWLP